MNHETLATWGSAPDPEVLGGMGALLARWPGAVAFTPAAPNLAIRHITASLGGLLLSRARLRLPAMTHNNPSVGIDNSNGFSKSRATNPYTRSIFSTGPLTDASMSSIFTLLANQLNTAAHPTHRLT